MKQTLKEIGQIILKPVTRKLIGYLYHQNSNVKYKSGHALSVIGDSEALQPMFEVLKNEPLNSNLAYSMAKFADTSILTEILNIYKDTEPTLKSNLAILLANYPSNDEVFQLLVLSLNDYDPNVRYNSVCSLGQIGNRSAVPHLLGCLAEINEWIFYAVLDALVKLKDPKSANPLCALYLKETNERKRAAIVKALGKLKELTSFTVITKALKDPDNRVVANALEALLAFDLSKEKVEVIVQQFLHNNDNRIRGNAVILALKNNITYVSNVLQDMANSADKFMRATAAYVLSKFKTDNYLKLVKNLLNDDYFLVKKNALNALYLQSSIDDFYELLSLLEHNNPIVRIFAVKTLAKLKINETLDYLHNLYIREDNFKVKSAILTALKDFDNKNSIIILNKALNDQDLRIKANAVEALSHILGSEAYLVLKNFVTSFDYRIKANALLGLLKSGNLEFIENLINMLSSKDINEVLSAIYVAQELGATISSLDSIPLDIPLKLALKNICCKKLYENNIANKNLIHQANFSSANSDSIRNEHFPNISDSNAASYLSNSNISYDSYKNILHNPNNTATQSNETFNPEILKHEAMQLFHNSQYKKALEKLTQYLSHVKDDVNAILLAGNLHYQLSNFEEAISYYTKVLKINPSNFQANFNIANAYYQIGNLDFALEYMLIALKLQPDSASVLINLANLYMKQQKWLNAVEMYQNALKYIRPTAKILANIAFAYQKVGNYLKACENYSKAIKENPNDPGIYYNYGLVLLKLQQIVEAKNAFKQALKLLDKNSPLKAPILELLERIK